MVSSFPGVQYGPLHYRNLELAKIQALKIARGKYDSMMDVTDDMKNDITWWLNYLEAAFGLILRDNPDIVLNTDAFLQGWGAVCEDLTAQGQFLPSEIQQNGANINALELLAIQYGLQCFATKLENKHVLIECDNTTAVSYINNMGGTHSTLCKNFAKSIWLWSINNNTWLTATHIPGKDTTVADFQSRHFNERTEWELDSEVFKMITDKLGQPKIDIFATYQNTKLPCYYSWKPDPGANHIDAFTISWHGPLIYCFPPFSLLGQCLQKNSMDPADAIVVIPKWLTQSYYTKAMDMLVCQSLLLPRTKR